MVVTTQYSNSMSANTRSEAGKLREGDELILLSQVLPDLSYLSNAAKAAS